MPTSFHTPSVWNKIVVSKPKNQSELKIIWVTFFRLVKASPELKKMWYSCFAAEKYCKTQWNSFPSQVCIKHLAISTGRALWIGVVIFDQIPVKSRARGRGVDMLFINCRKTFKLKISAAFWDGIIKHPAGCLISRKLWRMLWFQSRHSGNCYRSADISVPKSQITLFWNYN